MSYFMALYTCVVLKMDWCNTKINGTELDPKTQYPQMVRILTIDLYICTCTCIYMHVHEPHTCITQ